MGNILSEKQSIYLRELVDSTDSLLTEMEDFAQTRKIPILDPSSAQFLEQLIYLQKPKNFLEIGMAIGYSTIRVAKILQNDANIETIEKSSDNIKIAREYFHQADLSSSIKILEGEAKDILKNLGPIYDFIFLDADKEDYTELFDSALNLLIKGGVILVDNLLWKGYVASETIPDEYKKSTELIRKFNAKFIKCPSLKSSVLPIGDGLGLGIKLSD